MDLGSSIQNPGEASSAPPNSRDVFLYKGVEYHKFASKFLEPYAHLGTDTVHFGLVRQLELMCNDGKSFVDDTSVEILHGEVMNSLRNNRKRTNTEKENFRKIAMKDFVVIAYIDRSNEHINLSVLHRAYDTSTVFITDSMTRATTSAVSQSRGSS